MSSVIMARRKSDGSTEVMHEEGEQDPALMSVAEDLISAVHAKDAKAVAEALKAAWEVCESHEPAEPKEASEE